MGKARPTTNPEERLKDNSLRTLNKLVGIGIAVAIVVVIYAYSSEAGWTFPMDVMQKLPSMEDLWVQGNQVYNDIVIKLNEMIGLATESADNASA